MEEKFNSYNFSKDVDQYKEYLIHYYKYRKVNTELIDIINNLKVNNYNIYILSDNNNDFFEYFKESELFNMVNGYVISCEYGSLKKNGLLFEKLINKYNLNVDECYFIDDNINNIEIGLKYGIKGFVFNENIEQLYDDMRNNNINI